MAEPMTNREFVEQHWEKARCCFQPKRSDYREMVYWWVLADGKGPLCESVYRSEQETWSAAAEFTRERIEEIRQIRRQIEWCEAGLSGWFDPIYWHWDQNEREEESVVRSRSSNAREDVTGRLIVARLAAALADLQRGMRGQS